MNKQTSDATKIAELTKTVELQKKHIERLTSAVSMIDHKLRQVAKETARGKESGRLNKMQIDHISRTISRGD